ncbi:MAG: hypothetical protein KAG34_06750 [Cocleimonas sp.]|nr:hypothetical protein [Cocleimonas sp.]
MKTAEYEGGYFHTPFSEKNKRAFIVILVALFPIVLTSIVFFIIITLGNISFPDKITHESEFGKITSPLNNTIINKKFFISGILSELPKEQSIYLLENREGLFWPKYNLGSQAKQWSKKLTAHSKKGQFSSYLLVKANVEGQKIFETWFETSRKTGQYPGIKQINFAQIVAKIRVKTK